MTSIFVYLTICDENSQYFIPSKYFPFSFVKAIQKTAPQYYSVFTIFNDSESCVSFNKSNLKKLSGKYGVPTYRDDIFE